MMDRRDFLQLAALAAADISFGGLTGCATHARVPVPQVSGILAPIPSLDSYATAPTSSGTSKGRAVVSFFPHAPGKSRLRILNWDSLTHEDLEIPIGMAHAITQSKSNPLHLYVFELFGGILRVDLESKTFTFVDPKSAAEMSSGHGAVTASGEYLACTSIASDRRSRLVLRSSKTLEQIAIAPRECGNSHQVVGLPDSNLLAVGNIRDLNGGVSGAITFFDTNERRVANRLEFPHPILHLTPLSATEVIGISRVPTFSNDQTESISVLNVADKNREVFAMGAEKVPTPIFYASADGTKKEISTREELSILLANFGIAKISKTKFLSGHEGSNKVVLWEDFKKKHVFEVEKPTSITVSGDGTQFLVISDDVLAVYSLESFGKVREFRDWPNVATIGAYK